MGWGGCWVSVNRSVDDRGAADQADQADSELGELGSLQNEDGEIDWAVAKRLYGAALTHLQEDKLSPEAAARVAQLAPLFS